MPRPLRIRAIASLAFAALSAGACATREAPGRSADCPVPCTLVVSSATTLARPLRAALDSFARRTGVATEQENGGSLELARQVAELGQVPDVLALADREVFPALLVPAHAKWYALFARNRMVLAWTDRSREAARIDSASWRRVLLAPGVESARSDPDRDPMGYRTLLLFQLAERHYRQPGLAARLTAAAPARHMRPRSSELVGLLQAGEVDYIWTYESVARAAGLRWLTLPSDVDLSSAADSATYATASVRVAGRTPRDTVIIHGAPVLYGLTIPLRAPHPAVAARFAAWLLGSEGRAVLRAEGLDVLEAPVVVGDGVPAAIAATANREAAR